MRIATWNINGVKARMTCMMKWLADVQPDVVCLQEIKAIDEEFPRMEIEALGYNVETFGQKSWNGVAILSKNRFDEVTRGLPGDDHGFSEEILPMHIVDAIGDLKGLVRENIPRRNGYDKLARFTGPGETPYDRYDRDIAARAQDWLREAARRDAQKPWALFVSSRPGIVRVRVPTGNVMTWGEPAGGAGSAFACWTAARSEH